MTISINWNKVKGNHFQSQAGGVAVLKAPPHLDAAALMYWLNRAQAISNEFCEGLPITIVSK